MGVGIKSNFLSFKFQLMSIKQRHNVPLSLPWSYSNSKNKKIEKSLETS